MENLQIPSNILEQMILSYCRHNVSFFLNIKSYLDTSKLKNKSYFNDEKNQKIFNIACRFFDKFKKFPLKKTFISITERLEEDADIKLLLGSIVDRMYDTPFDELDPEFIENETKEFIKEAKAYEAILLAQYDIENRNFGNIVNRIEEAVRINFDKDLGVSVLDTDEVLNRIRQLDQVSKLTTGFPNLDTIVDGGLHPKEMFVISGIPGSYKTGFLGNIAINSFIDGKKVLVYTFETSVERLSMRYFQNLSEMTKQEIIMNEDGLRQKIDKVKQLFSGDIILKEYNSNAVSSNDLMAHINDLLMYKKWKPDLLIVDYILIMNTNDRTLSSSDSYKYYKTVTEELRNIGKTLYIPIVSACQINREGMSDRGGSKALVTAKDIAESRGIYDTTDIFTTIIQTANDKKKNQMFLYIDKNRNERTGMRIQYNVDYERHKITEGNIFV